MRIPGIDISKWQGDFDLAKAKSEGFEFVIVKGGGSDAGGRYVDSKFAENYKKAKALGMPVGVYWYTNAKTVADAVADAEYMHKKILNGRQFELPVYFDVEGEMLRLSKRLLTDICLAWCRHLEALGYWVGIYGGYYTFRDNMYDDELQGIAHWLAQWSKAPSYNRDCLGMWQYGGETNVLRSNKVAGQVCDQDYMLVDYPAMIKAAGRNGFTKAASEKPTPQPESTGYNLTTRTMKKGDEGEDVRALQILLIGNGYTCGKYGPDGKFGPATDSALRNYQQAEHLTVDGKAGPDTMGRLLGL